MLQEVFVTHFFLRARAFTPRWRDRGESCVCIYPFLIKGVRALRDFEKACRAHAATDAHGADDVLGAPAFPFDQGVTHHAGAAHAVGMANRNSAAVHVQVLVRDAELIPAVENLNRESFVELPKVDVVHLETRAFQKFRHCIDRPDAHLVRLKPETAKLRK